MNSPSSLAGPGPGAATSGDGSAPTHWSLIARLKDLGTDEDWRRFVDNYGRLIYAVAVRSGLSDAEAQEVVQETLVSAKGVSPIIEELTPSKAWQRVRRVCRASLESSFPEPFTT